MEISASVVIPTYNKVERLRLVLESFTSQSELPENFELVIVDDGSSDGTEALVNNIDAQFKIKYIRQNNSGRSHARNTGIKAGDGKIIIFCDDDCMASKDFVKAHLRAHSCSESRVVHGLIYNLPYLKFFKDPSSGELYDHAGNNGTSDFTNLRKHLINLSDIADLKRVEAQRKKTIFEKQLILIFEKGFHELKWLGCTGGNFSCSKQSLLRVGMFDEDLDQKWGCEDLELGYRLYRNGASFQFCDEGCNYHISHFRKSYKEELLFSVKKFHQKHQDPIVENLPLLLLGEIKNIEEYLKFCRAAEACRK